MTSMRFVPLAPQFGVEVQGVDLLRPPRDDEVGQLREALDRHKLLLFRGQHLSDEEHLRCARSFGFSVVMNPGDKPRMISNRRAGGDDAITFHCDHIFTAGGPSPGLTLHALELPPAGTSTMFSDTALALITLPESTRRSIANLAAWSAWVPADCRPVRRHPGINVETGFRSLHPVVATHPRTGRSLLLVSDEHTERIDGLSPEASFGLLEELCRHIAQPAHHYQHDWQQDDLVVWDNIVLQHARGENLLERGARTLRRFVLDSRGYTTLNPLQVRRRNLV
jgi:alpha-ketoglutarate-dependent taurine dioxygenase